jgi:hypothetical protein
MECKDNLFNAYKHGLPIALYSDISGRYRTGYIQEISNEYPIQGKSDRFIVKLRENNGNIFQIWVRTCEVTKPMG